MRLVMVVTAVAAAAVVAIMIVIIMTCLLSPSFVLKQSTGGIWRRARRGRRKPPTGRLLVGRASPPVHNSPVEHYTAAAQDKRHDAITDTTEYDLPPLIRI